MLLAAALAVSPATELVVEPGDAAGGEAIGVVWHDQATVAPALQQRLADELARRAGVERQAVVADASTRARARVPLELPRSRVDQVAGWRSMLDEASAAYRAGQLPMAGAAVDGLLETIHADPVAPGAAVLAWRAHMLRAQLAWAQGDASGLEQALAAAVALDPEATPSTREVPPPVVEAYVQLRAKVVAEASRWPRLQIVGTPGVPFAMEIDGVPGQRPVPPGEHLVVVRSPGRSPVGAVVRTSVPWVIPEQAPQLRPGLPPDRETAQRICDAAEVDWLVLARVRDDRLGLQRFTCGEGFGAAWYEAREGWSPGLDHVIAGAGSTGGSPVDPVLHEEGPWPAMAARPRPRPAVVAGGGSPPSARAQLRRALPWLLISGAIAGAVTVGVLVAGEPNPNLAIDGKSFVRP